MRCTTTTLTGVCIHLPRVLVAFLTTTQPQNKKEKNHKKNIHKNQQHCRRYSNGYCHNLNSQYAMPQVEAYPYAPSHSSNSFYSGSSRSSASLCQYQTQSFDYCEQSINSNQSHSQSSSQGQSPSWFETSKITVSTPVEQALGAEDLESSTGERGRPLELLTTPSSRSRSAASTNSRYAKMFIVSFLGGRVR